MDRSTTRNKGIMHHLIEKAVDIKQKLKSKLTRSITVERPQKESVRDTNELIIPQLLTLNNDNLQTINRPAD
jgi:hypothetical protein